MSPETLEAWPQRPVACHAPHPVPPSVPPAWPSGPREPVAQVCTPRGSQDVTVTVKTLATESTDVGFLLCPLVAM